MMFVMMFSHIDTVFDISISVNTQSGLSRYSNIVMARREESGNLSDAAGRSVGYGVATSVRLDKFMKVSRLSRRRSEAHEALEHGRITKDGKALKPAYQVKPGDVLDIHYATRFVTVVVRDVPLRVTPAVKPADLYDIVSTRRDEPADWA
jgi:ribosomal 50S subunit-recycling heat shock protein